MLEHMRQVPSSAINLFQLIYILIREYEAAHGERVLNLSLGNPDLIPPPDLLELRAKFQTKTDYDFHTYAEDKNLNQFCERLIRAFTGVELTQHAHLRAVPIAGIKTATALLPLACGLHLKPANGALPSQPSGRDQFKFVTHLPAYDVAGTWGQTYLGAERIGWPLETKDGMRINVDRLKEVLKEKGVEKPHFIWVIRPGNPASQATTRAEWVSLIEFCIERGIRLGNDGAYTTLQDPNHPHVSLAEVACEYPELEWVELYSVSKAFSDPGARLGALIGSKDFVEDFILIKGNTDSGPVPSVMAAYAEYLKDEKRVKAYFAELYATYRKRIDFIVPRLKKVGLELACEPTAGFFTLWKVPKVFMGFDVWAEAKRAQMSPSEWFNRKMIASSGIVGVHFQGPSESYIRYAVCSDVLAPEFSAKFDARLTKMFSVG